MTSVTIGIICLGLLFVLLLMRMPIAITMGFVGFLGFAWLRGADAAFGMAGVFPYDTWNSYLLSVGPLFMLMGHLCYHSGVSTDLYEAVHKWVGHMRGGLALATVGGCAAFAAVSGSSIATAVTMGSVALPEMKKYKYDRGLACGILAAGGTMGSMIPPSMALIFYGIITEQSIGKLFMAGFLPGITEAIFYMVTVYLLCLWKPELGPRGPVAPMKEKVKVLKKTAPILCLFVLIIGGLYFGLFSPTEAGGVGAFGAFTYSILSRRLSWDKFQLSLVNTVKVAAMVLLIVAGATMLNTFLAVSRLPTELGDFVSSLPLNRYVILAFILSFYLILGCFMDPLSMILLTMPIFYPLVIAMDFNPIWFGILIVRVCEIGCITPPMGMTVFVIKGIAGNTPVFTIYKGVLPFICADLLHLILLIAFPQIALFLPEMMTN
ncbi:TRAP transporter large permease [Desulfopila aestuarii]|uniref:TRAP transporter, DctM subunit n=1 Tax=Desulfopila aestuarii DSM 18488 TaxID=1121416 RepID=A0A1M7XXZ3_9BACT|nr:TRAP transporter large permease [Desulfopila aestuarii]SHO43869.1 TRAP transporter, DctM subunit [Desulfopila aestuarii DSM 18488]